MTVDLPYAPLLPGLRFRRLQRPADDAALADLDNAGFLPQYAVITHGTTRLSQCARCCEPGGTSADHDHVLHGPPLLAGR